MGAACAVSATVMTPYLAQEVIHDAMRCLGCEESVLDLETPVKDTYPGLGLEKTMR